MRRCSPAIKRAIRHAGRWGHTLTTEPATLQQFAATLTMPVLYMTGDASPDSSLAVAVADLLAPALPHATRVRFPALGHMAPITHPDEINKAIEDFLVGL